MKSVSYILISFLLFAFSEKVNAFTISGPTSVNMGQTVTYTASSVFGCDVDWVITGGVVVAPCNNGGNTCTTSGNTITVRWNCTSAGTHRVYGEKAGVCFGTGQLDVTVNLVDISPGTISGFTNVCPNTNNAYVIPIEGNATSYTWATTNGAITSGQGTRTANINWTNPGGTRTVTLTTYYYACPTTAPSTKTVFVNTLISSVSNISGSTSVCAGATSLTYSVPSVTGATSYSWSVPPNVTINSGQNTNIINVNYSTNAASGTMSLVVSNPCSSVTKTLAVTVSPLPSSPETITGPISACIWGGSALYYVPPILNATSYMWTITGGSIVSGNGTNSVTVNWTSAGTRSLTVKGSNSCGNGATETLTVNVYASPPANNDSITFNHTQMASATSIPLIINHCASNALCATQTLKKAKVYLTINTGDDYEYGTNTFSAACTASITGYNAYSGGSPVISFQKQLNINQNSPEQLFVADFTSAYYQVQRFEIVLTGYSSSSLVQNTIKVQATYKEEFNTNAITQAGQPLITAYAVNTNPVNTNKLTFSWGSSCGSFPNYEFQLLRLYNIDSTKARVGNEQQITARVDWNNALTIETQSSATTLTLSVVEGTGYYVWRVRPIGNFYEGGIANDKNWGAYTSTGAFIQNATVSVSASTSPYCFFYTQFEKDLNWIYSRFFVEGDEGKTGVKIKESMAFANGLMQTKQSQTLLSTEKNILVGQSVYDFSGRPSLSPISAPMQQNYFNYAEQFLQQSSGVLYTADHFDLDANYKNPNPIQAGVLATYFSNNTPGGDLTIPNAEGFPYSRVLYSKDGTERNAEIGTPGLTHRILQNQNETSHTKKQFYSGVSEEELLRVFGDEAPKANTVHKVIAIDENNTASISYINKEGQNIATCLSAGSNTLILDSLNEAHGPILAVNDLLTDGTALAPNGMITTKPVAFITPTTLKVYYKITPKSIQADCGSYCRTCDYKVYFILRNILEPDAPGFPKKDSLIIPGGSCPSASTGINPYIEYQNLAPGSYMVEKRIFTANINPNTGISYLNEAITTYSNQLNAEIGSYFNTIMGYVNSHDLNGLNNYLQNSSGLEFDQETNSYLISGGCSRIYIPFLQCSTPSCSATNFEQALINKWSGDTELNLGTNIKNYFQSPWTGADSVSAGKFNALVANMINDPNTPYNCQELWNCWNNIVQGYKLARQQYALLSQPYDPIEQFLQCAGKELRGISSVKNTTSYSSPGYLSHAYACFKSSLVASTCTSAINAIAPLSYPYSDTAQWHWTQLYNCSVNNDPSGSTNTQSYVDTLENRCNIQCEARYAGFVQSLLTAYRNDPRYVILGEAIPNGTQTAISMEAIYCSASRLVANCKNGCNLTVQGGQAGTTAEIEAMTRSMTYAYEVSLPDANGNCVPGSTVVTGASDQLKLLVDYLNAELEEFKTTIGPGISNLNVYDLLSVYNPSLNTCFSPTTTVAVSNTIACYFYIQNTCTLRYASPVYAVPLICNNMCKSEGCNNVCFKWVGSAITSTIGDTISYTSCEEETLNYIAEYISHQRQSMLDNATQAYRQKYINACTNMNGLDSLKINYKLDYYHYVLSYYDRAGHLIRTVPPAGVNILDASLAAVKNRQVHPNHVLVTEYEYNSLGQLIRKSSPDAGEQRTYYNLVGQPRFTQSAEQYATNSYVYTKYDALGRPIEKGKSTQNGSGSVFTQSVEITTFPTTGTEKTFIIFSTPTVSGNYSATKPQRNLLNNVSYAYTDKDGSSGTTTDRAYTYFSYDPHGNVEWMVQDLPELGKNYMLYEYDLISKKVLKTIYNEKKPDQFMHRFSYDADNRLTSSETSKNGILWERDASYSYYKHGPLKRAVLGEDKLQGLDYVHTIQGNLKAINHPALDKTIDPGQDGNTGSNSSVAQDAFGMILNYYQNDFNRTGSAFNSTITNSYYLPGTDLFNGHIISQVSNITPKNTGLQYEKATGYVYRYDLLGRLKRSDFSSYTSGAFISSTDYLTQYTYDANGNMLTHKRNGYASASLSMDQLTYNYYPGTNRLKYVTDAIATTTAYASDMESQTNTLNYTYDNSGNLKTDAQNNSTITWNISDRIEQVLINPAGTANDRTISFTYDAFGRRVIKKEIATVGGALIGHTFYVYDANGILMSVYKKTNAGDSTFFNLDETTLYGKERIGMRTENILVKKLAGTNTVTINSSTDSTLLTRKVGQKLYEIKDHLDNARVIINDIKQPLNVNNLSLGFTAQIQTYSNYDAFGMQQVGRNYNSTDYRYGFNGKEKDGELLGEGNSYDFGARIYDPRLGRWLSVDPLADKFPDQGPYSFAFNNPISFIDPDGKAPKKIGDVTISEELIPSEVGNVVMVLNKTDIFKAIILCLADKYPGMEVNISIGTSDPEGKKAVAYVNGSGSGGRNTNLNIYFTKKYAMKLFSTTKDELGYHGDEFNAKYEAASSKCSEFSALAKDPYEFSEKCHTFIGTYIPPAPTGKVITTGPDPTAIAAVLLHESWHLIFESEIKEGVWEHETMATSYNREFMIEALKEFDKAGGYTHTEEWYEAASWTGLHQTWAWWSLPKKKRDEISRISIDFGEKKSEFQKKKKTVQFEEPQ